MSSKTDREVHDGVVRLVEEWGFDIKSASFDAKSRDLSVRGNSFQPLTVFELQRQVNEEVLMRGTKKEPLRQKIADYIDAHHSESGVPTLKIMCLRKLIAYSTPSMTPQQPEAERIGSKKLAVTRIFSAPLSKIPIKHLRVRCIEFKYCWFQGNRDTSQNNIRKLTSINNMILQVCSFMPNSVMYKIWHE